jgi:hypothetical protein
MRKPEKKQPKVEETPRELHEQELEAVNGGWSSTTTTSNFNYGDGPVTRK